uniref:Ankyrin repeat domain-containing protein n=1 Tax=Hucho hucho TaxID=62062 RepID=A0A4W5NUL5_9TELE
LSNPGARDRQGRTSLQLAATTQGEGAVVGLLLLAGADPDATDREKTADAVLTLLVGKSWGEDWPPLIAWFLSRFIPRFWPF